MCLLKWAHFVQFSKIHQLFFTYIGSLLYQRFDSCLRAKYYKNLNLTSLFFFSFFFSSQIGFGFGNKFVANAVNKSMQANSLIPLNINEVTSFCSFKEWANIEQVIMTMLTNSHNHIFFNHSKAEFPKFGSNKEEKNLATCQYIRSPNKNVRNKNKSHISNSAYESS